MTKLQDFITKNRELADASCEGPWSFDEDELEVHSDVRAESCGDPYHIARNGGEFSPCDGRFIAASRTALPLALAMLERAVGNLSDFCDSEELYEVMKDLEAMSEESLT